MSVKRYEPFFEWEKPVHHMRFHQDGRYVLASDYDQLRADYTRLENDARELARELAYVHESPTLDLAKSSHGAELLVRPSIATLLLTPAAPSSTNADEIAAAARNPENAASRKEEKD